MKYFWGTVVMCLALTSCVPTDGDNESGRNGASEQGRGDARSESSRNDTPESQEDERLVLLQSLSYAEALSEDWELVVSILALSASDDSDLGIVQLEDSGWIAYYDSGFASSRLIEMEEIDSETVRFWVEIWPNANPEEPFAPRQPETPTYRFYVDLSESVFRVAVRTAIIEDRRFADILLPAYDSDGEPVPGDWYDHVSAGGE